MQIRLVVSRTVNGSLVYPEFAASLLGDIVKNVSYASSAVLLVICGVALWEVWAKAILRVYGIDIRLHVKGSGRNHTLVKQ